MLATKKVEVTFKGINGEIGGFFTGDPSNLIAGQQYLLTGITPYDGYTAYTLKDFKGTFDADWFIENPAKLLPPTYFAISKNVPVVGQRLWCSKFEIIDDLDTWDWVHTSTVLEVLQLGLRVYAVRTLNSTYIIQR